MRLPLALVLCSSFGMAQEAAPAPKPDQESPAQIEAKKAAVERAKANSELTIANAVAPQITTLNPTAIGAGLITGLLSNAISTRVAGSTWAMNMTQKYSARAIAEFMSKQEKEPFEVSNSKVDGLVLLVFSAKGMTQEKAERLARQEPMWKFRKTGWDRVVFTNGTDYWAWDTSVEIPPKN